MQDWPTGDHFDDNTTMEADSQTSDERYVFDGEVLWCEPDLGVMLSEMTD